MDAYEATRVVFSRIQALYPENAAKIMGLILLQDHGDKEMIRLAFGPDTLLHSLVLNARNNLPPSPSPPPFLSSSSSSSSWPTTPPPTSNTIKISTDDELITSPFFRGGGPKHPDHFTPEECRIPSGDGMQLPPYGLGWEDNGKGWTRPCSPCLYFSRGHCKNGSSCRFLHPDADASKVDAAVEQHRHEMLLLRSNSMHLGMSHSIESTAAAFPTGSLPSAHTKNDFLLQQHGINAAALMLGGDETQYRFMGRSYSPRMERGIDFAGMVNPCSRQIYLTFPADSTFREEDVSNYFSIYGPVEDVRIPYQQKRMFGFVTFVYPDTVKLILAKGNPHFVCDSRVLVKPYKEKGKVPDKYRKQQAAEKGDAYTGCSTPTDPYDIQQLGERMMMYGSTCQEALLRKRLEEQELQQAIELQGRRFMGLQLLDLKNRILSTPLHNVTATHLSPGISISNPPIGKRLSSASCTAASAISLGAGQHETPVQAAVNSSDKEESAGETKPNVDTDFQQGVEHSLPDSPFASPTKSSVPVDSFSMASMAVAEAAASAPTPSISSSTNHLMASSFKSCFFQMPADYSEAAASAPAPSITTS